MDKWVCTICGYVYDPAQGDPDAPVVTTLLGSDNGVVASGGLRIVLSSFDLWP